MATFIVNAINWVKNQSDQTHNILAVAGVSSLLPLLPSLSPTALAITNLTSHSIQFGTQAYVSCVGGPTMFLNMPRFLFGDIQSRLFPKMGQLTVGTGIVSLASYWVLNPGNMDSSKWLLTASLGLNMINCFWLFAKVADLMMKRRKSEEGSEERRLTAMKFGIGHGVSVLITLASMAANFAYICNIGKLIGNAMGSQS